MKKISKILLPVVFTTSVLGAITPTLFSCSKDPDDPNFIPVKLTGNASDYHIEKPKLKDDYTVRYTLYNGIIRFKLNSAKYRFEIKEIWAYNNDGKKIPIRDHLWAWYGVGITSDDTWEGHLHIEVQLDVASVEIVYSYYPTDPLDVPDVVGVPPEEEGEEWEPQLYWHGGKTYTDFNVHLGYKNYYDASTKRWKYTFNVTRVDVNGKELDSGLWKQTVGYVETPKTTGEVSGIPLAIDIDWKHVTGNVTIYYEYVLAKHEAMQYDFYGNEEYAGQPKPVATPTSCYTNQDVEIKITFDLQDVENNTMIIEDIWCGGKLLPRQDHCWKWNPPSESCNGTTQEGTLFISGMAIAGKLRIKYNYQSRLPEGFHSVKINGNAKDVGAENETSCGPDKIKDAYELRAFIYLKQPDNNKFDYGFRINSVKVGGNPLVEQTEWVWSWQFDEKRQEKYVLVWIDKGIIDGNVVINYEYVKNCHVTLDGNATTVGVNEPTIKTDVILPPTYFNDTITFEKKDGYQFNVTGIDVNGFPLEGSKWDAYTSQKLGKCSIMINTSEFGEGVPVKIHYEYTTA